MKFVYPYSKEAENWNLRLVGDFNDYSWEHGYKLKKVEDLDIPDKFYLECTVDIDLPENYYLVHHTPQGKEIRIEKEFIVVYIS